jgi:hypothetical protein
MTAEKYEIFASIGGDGISWRVRELALRRYGHCVVAKLRAGP